MPRSQISKVGDMYYSLYNVNICILINLYLCFINIQYINNIYIIDYNYLMIKN